MRKVSTLTEGANQSYADSATDQGMHMWEMALLLAFNIGVPHLARISHTLAGALRHHPATV